MGAGVQVRDGPGPAVGPVGETVVMHPSSNQILGGVSRQVVLELCGKLGFPMDDRAITVGEMSQADEAFHTGILTEVRSCVEVDGMPIGTGKVGPVTRALFDALLEETERVAAGGPQLPGLG